MTAGPVNSKITQVAQQLSNNPAARNFLNPPVKHIVLPGLLIGNMAYKLGTEKDPQKRSDVMWNSMISWLGGVLLTNKALPYYVLPGVAGALALFKIAQQDTPEAKTDTAINHATWWTTGMVTQAVAKMAKLKSPFSAFCAFAVGASVLGPIVAHFVKQKVMPLLPGVAQKNITNGIGSLTSGYPIGQKQDINFSPFGSQVSSPFNQFQQEPKSDYDMTDPFHLKKSFPGAFSK